MSRMIYIAIIVILTVLILLDVSMGQEVSLDLLDYIRILFSDREHIELYGRSTLNFKIMAYNILVLMLGHMLLLGKWKQVTAGFTSMLRYRQKRNIDFVWLFQMQYLKSNTVYTLTEMMILCFLWIATKTPVSVENIGVLFSFVIKRGIFRQLFSLGNVWILWMVKTEVIMLLQFIGITLLWCIDSNSVMVFLRYSENAGQLIMIILYIIAYMAVYHLIRPKIKGRELE